MPRYEYKNLILTPCDATAQWINKLEEEGWELYRSIPMRIDAVFCTDFCLKRRRVEPRYEYKSVILSLSPEDTERLNALKADGWRVCGTKRASQDSYYIAYCLKLKRKLLEFEAINGVVFEHAA